MAQERPRGATPRPRSGGAAEKRYPASEVRGAARRSYPMPLSPRPGAADRRSYPRARGQGRPREELPRAMATRVQEGLKELSHNEGQEGQR